MAVTIPSNRKGSFINPISKRKRSAKVKTHQLEKEILEDQKNEETATFELEV